MTDIPLLALVVDLYNRVITPEAVRPRLVATDAFLDVCNRYAAGQIEHWQWQRGLERLWKVMRE